MNVQDLKIAAAAKALEFVEDNMRLGIGTGSTANKFIKLLAQKVAQGLNVKGVATSSYSHQLCVELGVPVTTLDEMPELDLTIDGADEIGPNMALIKGGGAALLREKIVAYASAKMIVIADESKMVETLGAFPLPIEVNPFGVTATKKAVEKAAAHLNLHGQVALRHVNGKILVTDGGHYILDASFGRISNPKELSEALYEIPGVVEHGLFLNLASCSIIAKANGEIKVLELNDI